MCGAHGRARKTRISTKAVDKLVDYRGTARLLIRKAQSGLGATKISAVVSAAKTSAYI
jgi:hypothetical protein